MKYNGKDKKQASQANTAPQRKVMANPYADQPKVRASKQRTTNKTARNAVNQESRQMTSKNNLPRQAPNTMAREMQAPAGGRARYVDQNVKRHKKKHKKNYVLYYILLIFIFAVTGITLSLTVFFNVGEIVVGGNVTVSIDEIKEVSGVKIGDNMLRMNLSAIEKKISDKYITIENVEISKKFPATLSIKVTMAKPKFSVTYEGKQYTISEQNRIIGVGDAPMSPDIPRIAGVTLKGIKPGDILETVKTDELVASKLQNDEFYKLSLIDTALEAIKENEMSEITVVDLSDHMAIKMYIGSQYEINVGGVSNLAYKLHCAKSIVDEQLLDKTLNGTIDVSVDNGMYYFRPAEKIEVP